jgi:hypothetical protein
MHEARRYTQPALSTLVKLMKSARSESVKLGAAEAILSRGWGRSVQAFQVDGRFLTKKLADLTPEELQALEERIDMMEDQPDMLDMIEDKGTHE